MRRRYGNPKKKSRFVCIKCGQENHIIDGVQRVNQREYLHIKDCECIHCKCVTKNVEIRYCDDYSTVMESLPELYDIYYGNKEKKVG